MGGALETRWRAYADRPATGDLDRFIGGLLTPLAWAYGLASALKRGFFWGIPGAQTRVDAPVISVGNITVGGTGKTPLTAVVAEHLAGRGVATTVLTRGYKASPPAPVLLAGRRGEALAPRGQTGDEAALLVRLAPQATIVVSKRRALGAKYAVGELEAQAVVLDDGLQYWRLYRDLDLITLDSIIPFGNGRIFPAGPLRERPASLARAGALILRHGPDQPGAVPQEIRQHAPSVPCYAARYVPVGWREYATGTILSLDAPRGQIRAAVCGIAQPQAFFRAVEDWAGSSLVTRAFADHYAFRAEDFAGLPGAVAVTEKDEQNLPDPAGLPSIYVLRSRLELEPLEGAPTFGDFLDGVLELS